MCIYVTCGLIEAEGKVLVARRAGNREESGLWEFPGGKLSPGETESECLRREIREELGAEIRIERRLRPSLHRRPDRSLCLIPFVCSLVRGRPSPLEHDRILWAEGGDLLRLSWCPADLPVLRQYLRERAPRLLEGLSDCGE